MGIFEVNRSPNYPLKSDLVCFIDNMMQDKIVLGCCMVIAINRNMKWHAILAHDNIYPCH